MKQLFDKYDTLVFFDTETTGLEADKCQIIELAMLVVKKDGTVAEYDEFVRLPDGAHVPEKIVMLTGITDEMLAAGISETRMAADFRDAVSGPKTLLIAHNCQFDQWFMRETLERVYGKKDADRIMYSLDWLDSLSVYKDRASYPHKLDNAIEHYGLSGAVANTHRAIDDTKALMAVCEAMEKERRDLTRYVNVFGYNPKYGVSGRKLGKVRYWPQPYSNGLLPYQEILPNKMWSYIMDGKGKNN